MIKVKEHKYYGYHQGWKVYIDGVKFPQKRGYFFTCKDKQEAINIALTQSRILAFNNTFKA